MSSVSARPGSQSPESSVQADESQFAAFMNWARKEWGLTISDSITVDRRDRKKSGVFALQNIGVSRKFGF